MFLSLHLVFVGGLLFAALWLVYISMQAGFTEALADPTGPRIRAALSRSVALALVTGLVAALLATPAISDLALASGVGGGVGHGEIVSSTFAAIWVCYLGLTVVLAVEVLRLLQAISVRRAGTR